MTDTAKKTGGRPLKAIEDHKTRSIGFRLPKPVHQALRDAAAANERSMSKEIEYRIELTFALERYDQWVIQSAKRTAKRTAERIVSNHARSR